MDFSSTINPSTVDFSTMDIPEAVDFSWLLEGLDLDLADRNFARNFGTDFWSTWSMPPRGSQASAIPRVPPRSNGAFQAAGPSRSSTSRGGGFVRWRSNSNSSSLGAASSTAAAKMLRFKGIRGSVSSGSSEEGSFVEWKKPWGICVSHSNVYVADRDGHQVSILSGVDHRLIRKFGTHGHGPRDLYRPTGVAFDPYRNRILVTDKDNHRVNFYNTDGHLISSFGGFGHGEQEFNYPWGVAVSRDGLIAVADSRNNRVQLFDHQGIFRASHSAITTNVYQFKSIFDYPRSVAFDNNGQNLYVVDFNLETAFKIKMSAFDTRYRLFPQNMLSRPQGITVGQQTGNILVCDANNCMVKVVTPGGDAVGYFPTRKNQKPFKPMDIAAFGGGVLVLGAEGQIVPLNIN